MLEKICPEHNVPVRGESCSKEGCGEKPIVSTTIYWCEHCNVPSFEKTCQSCGMEGYYISTDIRPCFPEEKVLLAILLEKESPLELDNYSVWNSSSGYIINGKRQPLVLKDLKQMSLDDVKKVKNIYDESVGKLDSTFFDTIIERFIEVNQQRFYEIDDEAITYIQSFSNKYSIEDMFVSFSGGKDSTVVSDLVRRAYATNKILHIYGDTTLEFDLTEAYRKRFIKHQPMIRAINREKNFEQLCKQIGPPSRVMRWCCTVFKTGAITKTLTQAFKGKTNVLTFYGIRKSESASRSKYERESESPKITMQTVVAPIINWIDFDVWLYILTRKVDFNEAYKLGYSRVGCWCCPNNGTWSEFLSKVHMYDKSEKWRTLLVNFSKRIGKPDPEEYVDSGNWKARQGGNGLEISNTSIIAFEPCATEDNAFNYELQTIITEDLYELFRPFGYLNKDFGNARLGEVYIMDKVGKVALYCKEELVRIN